MSEALKARLREPSTYVGIALLIEVFTGKIVSAEIMASTIGMVVTAVVGVSAFLGMVLSESK